MCYGTRGSPAGPALTTVVLGLVLLLALVLGGCAAQPTTGSGAENFRQEQASQQRVEKLNEQIVVRSSMSTNGSTSERDRESYRLGRDDLIEITILGVPELSREVRIDGNGIITLPLIGEVPVAGKTVKNASQLIADRYEESYLHNPQVSVLIKEYRSLQLTVLGSVKAPQVYSVQRRLSLLEALALAGGLTANAGRMVHITDRVDSPEGEGKIRRNFVVNLDKLVSAETGTEIPDLTLSDGAVVSVPEAGVVYVEGAVKKPGVYTLQRDTSVLKAISMAGGLQFAARESGIRVLRANSGEAMQQEYSSININELRNDPDRGLELRDGDVVVVEASGWKSALQGVAVSIGTGVFGFGYRP